MIEDHELDEMVDGYITCALWSSTDNSRDDGGDPLDDNYGPDDIEEESLARMREECRVFAEENEATLRAAFSSDAPRGGFIGVRRNWPQAGHDFWLTRNGHGCGFWETPDWPKHEGALLTEASKKAGVRHLNVGDDGRIYYEKG